jgi:hypothetical protein
VSPVELEQLTEVLTQTDADPDAVLAAFRVKRHRRARRRHLAVGGGLAAAVIVALVVVLQQWATAPRLHLTPGATGSANPPGASGCASIPLRDVLAMARQGGASVIVADGSLTGRSVVDGQVYDQMALRAVRTLSGPAIASGGAGWVASVRGPAGPIPGADAGALWAPDGRLFAIAWPARETGTTVGPVLRVAPVVDGQVIFSSAGCWDTSGLPTRPYHGPLAGIPGSGSYARAAAGGFRAVSLTIVERLISGISAK